MKKLLVLLLLPFFGIAQNNKLQGKSGFENYIFGTTPAEYKNLTLEIDEGNTKLYSASTKVNMTGVEVADMNITFVKNQLSTICLKTKNSTGQKLLQNLKENYGEPNKSGSLKGSYEWIGDKLHLIYEPVKNGTDATASFYSKEMYTKNKK